ncbi:MAG: hypothetical protein ACOYK8_00790 [Alphaproteobacteria bacterium]
MAAPSFLSKNQPPLQSTVLKQVFADYAAALQEKGETSPYAIGENQGVLFIQLTDEAKANALSDFFIKNLTTPIDAANNKAIDVVTEEDGGETHYYIVFCAVDTLQFQQDFFTTTLPDFLEKGEKKINALLSVPSFLVKQHHAQSTDKASNSNTNTINLPTLHINQQPNVSISAANNNRQKLPQDNRLKTSQSTNTDVLSVDHGAAFRKIGVDLIQLLWSIACLSASGTFAMFRAGDAIDKKHNRRFFAGIVAVVVVYGGNYFIQNKNMGENLADGVAKIGTANTTVADLERPFFAQKDGLTGIYNFTASNNRPIACAPLSAISPEQGANNSDRIITHDGSSPAAICATPKELKSLFPANSAPATPVQTPSPSPSPKP